MKPFLLSGRSYDRGKAHGRHFRSQIQELVAKDRLSSARTVQERTGIVLSDQDWLDAVHRYRVHADAFAPDLVEEMEGIAEGAEIPFEDIFAFNAFLDFCDLSSPPLTRSLLFGCTTFAVTNTAARAGQSYIGQTYDWKSFYTRGTALLQYEPIDGLSVLLFTFAGLLGCAGMNSSGLGIVINKLTPSDSRPGVPYPFVLRKALEQTCLPDAIGVILAAPRASGLFYLLVDGSGEIIGLETTAKDHEVFYAMDDILAHTNHYVHPRLLAYDEPNRRLKADTYVRWSRINKLLKRTVGQIGLDDLKTFTCDHVGHPRGICQHPDPGESELESDCTNAGLIMELKTLKMWLAKGVPCESGYQEYALSQGQPVH